MVGRGMGSGISGRHREGCRHRLSPGTICHCDGRGDGFVVLGRRFGGSIAIDILATMRFGLAHESSLRNICPPGSGAGDEGWGCRRCRFRSESRSTLELPKIAKLQNRRNCGIAGVEVLWAVWCPIRGHRIADGRAGAATRAIGDGGGTVVWGSIGLCWVEFCSLRMWVIFEGRMELFFAKSPECQLEGNSNWN